MLMNVIRGAIAVVVFLPFGAFGQEGAKCLRDVLEQHMPRRTVVPEGGSGCCRYP